MEQLRKEGNELFKCGDYEGALSAYTQALGLGATPQDQAILHRNLAACHLKLVREACRSFPGLRGSLFGPSLLLLGLDLGIRFSQL